MDETLKYFRFWLALPERLVEPQLRLFVISAGLFDPERIVVDALVAMGED